MGTIVGAFVLPHEPSIFRTPKEKQGEGHARVAAAFDTVKRRIGELGATTVVIVGADHYVLFGPGCLPCFLIGIGDLSGPYEKFPGIEGGPLPANEPLAQHIAAHGREHGFDWAVAKSLNVDHSIGLPARMCALPNASVKAVVPVYLASGVQPLIPKRRAFELGGAIAAAVRDWPQDERVVVIGSGGISHWVGMPEMGKVNTEFDAKVLKCVADGDPEPLIALRDEEIVATAGNGALEIRNFLCAMGALKGRKGSVIEYQQGPHWVAGLGFAEIHA